MKRRREPLVDADLDLRPLAAGDDPSEWEAIADSADGPMGFVVTVEIAPEAAPAIVNAARQEGLTVTQLLQRHVDALIESLRHEASAAAPAGRA